MNAMKKAFAMLGAAFAFGLSVFAGSPGVTFLLRDGKKVSFAFVEKPIVAMNESNLSVNVGGVQRVSYAYADVQRVLIDDDVVSAVDDVVVGDKAQHVVFTVTANTLSVSGLMVNERIALYASDGKLVINEQAGADGKASISMSSLQQGIYVVRTQNGISYKLFKK